MKGLRLQPVMEVKIPRGKLLTSIYLMTSLPVPEPFLFVQIPAVQLRTWCRGRPSSQSTFISVSWLVFFFDRTLFNFFEMVVQSLCAAVPLYQEYCLQEMRGYLRRMNKNPVSALLSPQYIQTVQSRIRSNSEAALPPPEQGYQKRKDEI